MADSRVPFDFDAYAKEIQAGPCWLCQLAEHDPAVPKHFMIYETDEAVVFLNRFPTVRGATIVAPREHREAVVQDFRLEEYLTIQRLVWRVGRALHAVLQPERVYVASLGSHQLNAHVHWHVVPVPEGVPPDKQQTDLLDLRQGYLEIDDAEMRVLAADLSMMLMAI